MSDPKNIIFNPKGKKMAPFFHVMISYRVSTEHQLARNLFDRLLLNSFKRIPMAGMSPWPHGFEEKRPGDANVFLDQVCLKSGENWKHSEEGGGFVGALLKSLIFVPLLSWRVEFENKYDPESKKRFKGSIGEMVARFSGEGLNTPIDPNSVKFCDDVDNVLLELILAMELHAHLKQIHKDASCMHPCLRLFPVVVDDFPDTSKLPHEVSEKTYAEASKVLETCDIRIQDKKTVRDIVKHFCTVQAVKFKDLGREDLALDSLSSKIISAVSDTVSKIDPQSMFESKPLCRELDAFLSNRNCSYMTSVLATNSITSLRQLSFLTHQKAIYDLAKQCSSVSSKSIVAEFSTLASVIEDSKRDEASWLLSARLDRFVDTDASFATVIKSSSGLIISCAQKSWLTLYFLLAIAMLVIGAISVASNGPGGNTIFDFVVSAFLFGVCLAAKLHSPKRGFLIYCCMWPATFVAVIIGFCFDFIKNGSFSLDNAMKCSSVGSQLQTSFRTCAVAEIMRGPCLTCLLILLNLYQALKRQDLAWTTYLFSVALSIVTSIAFEIGVLGYSVLTQTNFIILFGVACIFSFTELMYRRARDDAIEAVSKDEAMYNELWTKLESSEGTELIKMNESTQELLSEFGNSSLKEVKLNWFTKTLGKVLNSARSVEVLQDCKDIDVLYARAEFINDAFQSLVSVLLESSLNTAAQTKAAAEAKAAAGALPADEAKAAAEAKVATEAKAADDAKAAAEAKAADDAKVAAKFRRVRNVLEQLQLLKLYNGLVAEACSLTLMSSLLFFVIRICPTD
jgi:hypothetical protein